ncbi:BRISC complex subunit Abraxas 2-like [Actinia tenebrosa]|uniref:BRISC complex subunit Abraxas 2-like n=1 Tax=Actinia tenebrosa TaxID=6105 RepID=A0A6P8GZV8_ACTTE|nr:BRISC complex subunit Abraxas 2-like [Actinia tenebrosa]
MEVRVSGPVLSSLFLELANGKGDLEGFLLGDTSGRTVNTISDSSSQHLSFERIATIQGFIPRERAFSFYDSVGSIDKKKIEILLGKNKENVIGWYRYRRNTQSFVSMRERHVHHNLIREINFTPAKEFVFIIFTASTSAGMSVHSFDYNIVSSSHVMGTFTNHEMKVVNLGDTCHSEYRLQPETIRTPSKVFTDVINIYREDFIDKDGCLQQPLATHSMCISLMTKMKELLTEVNNSESTVGVMTEQVQMLRENLEQKKREICIKLEQKRLLEQHEVQTADLIQITQDSTKKTEKQMSKSKQKHAGRSGASKTHSHSHRREVEHMDTSTSNNLIDFSDGMNVNRPSHKTALNQRQSLGNDYQNTRKDVAASLDVDDDETQDYSLPDDKCNQGVSTLGEQALLDSPTY